MKRKTLKPLTPQKRLDMLNELVPLLDTHNRQGHPRGLELIARLAYDAGAQYAKTRLSKKGAKHENKKPKVTDTGGKPSAA